MLWQLILIQTQSMKSTAAFVIVILSGFSAPRCGATIYNSDGSAANVQILHDTLARDGDTITVPTGTFTWLIPVTISKAIKIQGEGSGRIIGDTKSSVTVGIGARTFTTTRAGLPITAGQVLRVAKMPKGAGGIPARENYMEGTVTSYSGTTLVMNITSTGGSGTWQFWWIATQPATTIVNDYSSGGNLDNNLVQINQSLSAPTEITGIRFLANPATTNRSGFIGLTSSAYLNPKTKIHDCWFENDGGGAPAVFARTNQALIWNCSFDDTFGDSTAFRIKWEDANGSSTWTTNSTFGADDTNGATNAYVEDCDFHAYLNATDFDSGSRVVFRHNILDNSGMGSHGADTGAQVGLRHVELYDNELIFDNFGDCDGSVTLNVNWFFWQRGGTSVITDNIVPAISSCAWGTKPNANFTVLNTRRNSGAYCCWVGYPAPHQIGQGYGNGAVFHTFTGCGTYGQANYYTYSEPVYIWNNSGTGGNNVEVSQDSTDECGNNQQVADYIQAGRDYKLEPKPGYAKFTYPHPLRSSLAQPPPIPSATPNSPQRRQKKKGKKVKKWKWGRAKENSMNGVAEGQKELGE